MKNLTNKSDIELFKQMMFAIGIGDNSLLYQLLLYRSGSAIINDLNIVEKVNLLHLAAIYDNPIAFDILVIFGAKVDDEWQKLLEDKLKHSYDALSERIGDRIFNLANNSYHGYKIDDVLDKISLYPSTEDDIDYFMGIKIDKYHVSNKLKMLGEIENILSTIPEVKHLIQEATQQGPISVKFVPHSDSFSGGSWSSSERLIRIDKDISLGSIITTLIFELCNAANQEIENYSSSDLQDAEIFARAAEEKEYLSTQHYEKVITAIMNDRKAMEDLNACGISSDRFEQEKLNFYKDVEDYWMKVNKVAKGMEYSHADYYRRYYRQEYQFSKALQEEMNTALPTEVEALPTNVLENVLSYLDPRELSDVRLVSQQFNATALNDNLWERFTKGYFPFLQNAKVKNKDPKSTFMNVWFQIKTLDDDRKAQALFYAFKNDHLFGVKSILGKGAALAFAELNQNYTIPFAEKMTVEQSKKLLQLPVDVVEQVFKLIPTRVPIIMQDRTSNIKI